jgi:predicted DsbA family dithiol-disulfide isomerase
MSIPKVAVDIWSDVMCPWCAIGYAQFARAVAGLEGEIEVVARWMPFELNPEMPPEGKPQAAHIAEVYRRSDAEIAEMQRTMAARAEEAGFPMTFAGPDGEPAMMWNTFEAHKLLRWALAEAGPEAQTRVIRSFWSFNSTHIRVSNILYRTLLSKFTTQTCYIAISYSFQSDFPVYLP